MNNPRDIPRRIARFLFIVGVFWGLVLVVPTIATIGLSFQRGFRGWIIVGYLLSGFAVWGGWLWRSRQLRSLEGSVGLWVSSFVVNAAFPVILVATQSRWPQIFLHDEMRFLLWWWILASVLSVVAGVAEFKVLRHEVPAS